MIAHLACDGDGVSVSAVAESLGVGAPAIPSARHYGRNLLAARDWSVDDALTGAAHTRRTIEPGAGTQEKVRS